MVKVGDQMRCNAFPGHASNKTNIAELNTICLICSFSETKILRNNLCLTINGLQMIC